MNRMGCKYTGWDVVNGMWCYFPVWGVTKRDGVLFSGMGC